MYFFLLAEISLGRITKKLYLYLKTLFCQDFVWIMAARGNHCSTKLTTQKTGQCARFKLCWLVCCYCGRFMHIIQDLFTLTEVPMWSMMNVVFSVCKRLSKCRKYNEIIYICKIISWHGTQTHVWQHHTKRSSKGSDITTGLWTLVLIS